MWTPLLTQAVVDPPSSDTSTYAPIVAPKSPPSFADVNLDVVALAKVRTAMMAAVERQAAAEK
jgi:hypothetical protein